MRFRFGFASGFAAGYYLGAKAGRDRYNQIRSNIGQIRSNIGKVTESPTFQNATGKAREALGEGVNKAVEKAKDAVHRGSNGSPNGSPNGSFVPPVTGSSGPASAYAPYASETPPDPAG